MKNIKYSFIIPVYNEKEVIKNVIEELDSYLKDKINGEYELIVVNDGSSDGGLEILKKIKLEEFYLFSNPYNKGYGASLKFGAKKAKGEFLIFYDGDGQHIPQEVFKLIGQKEGYDMVVGSRIKYNGPMWRQPGKKVINCIANYLVEYKIPDLNSGLRVVRKTCFHKFSHLYPEGFSLSTTITLSFIKHGYNVNYVPIEVRERSGKSSVKILDGFKAINLVVRMIMLFAPLRIFFPTSILLFILMSVSLGHDILVRNISETTQLFFISTIFVFFIGLLADQIAAVRREMKF